VAVLTCSIALTGAYLSPAHQASAAGKPTLKRGITLSVWDWFLAAKDTPERVTFQKVVAGWEKKTGNHVNLLGLQPGFAKMCVAAPAGQGADLVGMPHDQLSAMIACKSLASVPSWAFPSSMQKEYIKPAIQGVTIGGKVWGLPWAIETSGVYYNKSLIPASFFGVYPKGVPLSILGPKAQSLTKNGNYGLVYQMNNFYLSYAFISAGGGYVFKYVKGKGFDWHQIGLDTAGAIKGLTAIQDLSDAGKYKLISPSMNDTNAHALFVGGKAAMYLTGPWNEADFKAHSINYGFAPDPALDSTHPAHPFTGIQTFAVNLYSKYQNEAFDLAQYVTRAMQLPEFKASGRIPVLKSLLASNTVQGDAIAKGLSQAALIGQPMPNIPEMAQVWTPAGNAIDLVTKGSMSPATAAQQTAAAIKSAIAKAHGG
jgi:arabinogalactan oligomer/maltooligosaccharide transport system substrate-binding protein